MLKKWAKLKEYLYGMREFYDEKFLDTYNTQFLSKKRAIAEVIDKMEEIEQGE